MKNYYHIQAFKQQNPLFFFLKSQIYNQDQCW